LVESAGIGFVKGGQFMTHLVADRFTSEKMELGAEALESRRALIADAFASSPAMTAKPARQTALRVGVVGCGYWGSKHIRVLSALPTVDAVAVIDLDRRACEKVAATFRNLRTFPDLEAAFPQVDALIVASPPRTHFEVALKCLQHGKHVLLEKPMARSLMEARTLIDEARRSNSVLMVGHTFEYNPAVRELRRRIALGELGQIYYLHSARLNLGLYRTDVNVIWDLAPHDISIMNYLLGSVPSAVSAWASANAWSGTEDLAYIRIEYEELGVTGFVRLSWLDPNKVREVIVVGSKRMAVYDDLQEERLRIFDKGVELCEQSTMSFERPLTYRYGDIVSPHIKFEEPLSLEVEHFVECVRDGTLPQTEGHSGLAVLAVLEAIDEAVATGGIVKVRYPGGLNPMRTEITNGHSSASACP
jgi:predicted dehydrogenase